MSPDGVLSGLWHAWLLPQLFQVTLLAVVVLGLDRLLASGRYAALRHALFCLLPLRLLVPPTVASPFGLGPASVRTPEPVGAGALDAGAGVAPGMDPATVATVIWLAGALVLAIAAVRRRRRVDRALRRFAVPADAAVGRIAADVARRLGLRRPPRVVLHPAVPGPLLAGLFRPRVFLPSPPPSGAGLEHALLHEMAHARRRDAWVQAAFDVLQALFWFHPLVHWARRRAHAMREVCCDLTVAGALGPEAGRYRRSLLELAASRHLGTRAVAGALPWISTRSTLLLRVEALAEPNRSRALGSRRYAPILALLVGAALLPATPAEADDGGGAVHEARALLERTFEERDRYGCFHRRWAYARWQQAVAADESAASPSTPASR